MNHASPAPSDTHDRSARVLRTGSFASDFLLACLIWTALLALVTWVWLSAEWLGLL